MVRLAAVRAGRDAGGEEAADSTSEADYDGGYVAGRFHDCPAPFHAGVTYPRNAKRSAPFVNALSTRAGSADAGVRTCSRPLFAFPLADEVTIVDLPGMKVPAEVAHPGAGDAPQYAGIHEQVP